LIKYIIILYIAAVCVGCSEFDLPTPEYILKRPIGTESVKIGMTKDHVMELWGGADEKYFEKIEEAGIVRNREVWVYRGRYEGVPVDAGYLSKTKYLYFDGINVTNITEKPLKTEE